MKKGVSISLIIGVVVVAAAGFIVWRNLGGPVPFLGTGVAAAGTQPRPGTPGASPAPGAARQGGPGATAAAGARGGRAQAHPVTAEAARIGTLQTVVKLTGEVAAATTVTVYPEVAGRVDQISVSIGSRVAAQTVLISVDPSRPGTRYEANPVRSPIAGTVIDLLVKRGQSVSQSTPAVTVATISDLELVVRVPERYAAAVTRQTVGKVHFDALGDRRFDARVTRLQPVIDPVSRSKEVVFAIPYGTAGIEPGMFGDVELVNQQVENAVIVPFETIVQEADANYVFVADGGKAVKRPVEIGLLAGEMIQVRSGLTGGESVVTSGQSFLENGSPISIVGKTAGAVGTAAVRQ